jgi:FixJ family two-component response regulator
MKPSDVSTVFVVDDDDLVHAAIHGMLKSVGLRSETFGTLQEFLRSERWMRLTRLWSATG